MQNKFVQLLSHNSELFALTKRGEVFIWNPNAGKWVRFPQ